MLRCVVSTLRNSTRGGRGTRPIHTAVLSPLQPANIAHPPRYGPTIVCISHEHEGTPETTPVAPANTNTECMTFASASSAPIQHIHADTAAPDASRTHALPAKAFAIDVLHAFLAPANIASPTPITHTPRALLELYHAARARGDLRKLSAGRFGDLIAVLGALGAGAGSPNSDHVPPIVKHMRTDGCGGACGWATVVQVVRDKVKMKEHLHSRDAYWLMRARLAQAGMESVMVDPHEDDQLTQARKVYLHGDFTGLCVEAHIPYLRVLLASSRRSAHVELLGWLVQIIDRKERCSKRLFAFLSNVAMTEGFKVKGDLLAELWRRVVASQPAKSLNVSRSEGAESTTTPWSCNGAIDMLRELTAVIIPNIKGFDLPSITQAPSEQHIRRWAIQQAQDFFSPELGGPKGNRWLYFSLLAQSNRTLPTLTRTALSALSSPTTPKLAAADFRIVAVLAILERLLIRPVRPDTPPDSQLVGALWNAWSKAVSDDPAVAVAVIRPILASFLRLAAATSDNDLRADAIRLSHTGFWVFDAGDAGARRQVQALASAVAAASAACDHILWNDIVLDFPEYARADAWQPLLAGNALRILAVLDGRRAHKAWAAWSMWIDLHPSLERVLVSALLRDGDVDAAFPLLKAQLRGVRGPERWEPLGEVLLQLARRDHPYVTDELGKVIANSLLDVEEPEVGEEVVRSRKKVRRSWARRGPQFPSNEEIDEVLFAPYEDGELEEEEVMQTVEVEEEESEVYNADIDVSEALAEPAEGILKTDAYTPEVQEADDDRNVPEATEVGEVDTPEEIVASETEPQKPVDIPPQDFHGRISWALRALVRSGYPLPAVLTFRKIILASPRYFGPEFIQDFLRYLLSVRHFHMAFRVLMLGSRVYPSHVPKWHNELFLHFVRKGASTLAADPHLQVQNRSLYLAISKTKVDLRPRRMFNLIKHRRGRRWKELTRFNWLKLKLQGQAVHHKRWRWLLGHHRRWMAWGKMMRMRYRRTQGELQRLKRRERLEAFRVYRALNKAKEVDVRLLNYGMPLIARVRGVVPAGRLYARVARDLDLKTRINLGNIIIHAQAMSRKRGNRRRVHRLREILETLVFHYDFTPDRITTNIVVKALLGWRREVDTRQVRALVNQFVKRGYPAGPNYSKKYLPFIPGVDGRSVFDPDKFRLPVHTVKLDFVRHVQPLYRMFITAMHKRKDQRGVKVMKEILHQVRLEHLLRERERRRVAAKHQRQKVT